VNVRDTANGGNGGNVLDGNGKAGNGGIALSSALGRNRGDSDVDVLAEATGGNGGQGAGGKATNGAGGNARAITEGRGGGTVNATSTATAGTDPDGKITGNATAEATAAGAMSRARATGTGASGTATSTATSNGGEVKSIVSRATAPVVGLTTTEARAAVAKAAPEFSQTANLQAVSFSTGLPRLDDVRAAAANDPKVQAAFNLKDSPTIFGLVALGGLSSSDVNGTSFTYNASSEFMVDLSRVRNRPDLLVGLLESADTGTGFDMLKFQIFKQNKLVRNEAFDTVAKATDFFKDDVLNLGQIAAGAPGVLDLRFLMSLTTDKPDAGFREDLIFGIAGTVPEPGSFALFALALLGLFGFAWFRANLTGRAIA
jgi:hypothetical protein